LQSRRRFRQPPPTIIANPLLQAEQANVHSAGQHPSFPLRLLPRLSSDYLAAGILPEAMGGLARSMAWRLKPPASIPQRIFPFGPISLIAPLRQEHQSCSLEIPAGIVEGRGGVGLMFARIKKR